jgi:Ca2+-binding EF-hand superfamily protein
VLRKAFEAFDPEKKGYIEVEMVRNILEMLDIKVTDKQLDEIIVEVDADGQYNRIKKKNI